jgi:hypothetical protein
MGNLMDRIEKLNQKVIDVNTLVNKRNNSIVAELQKIV